MKWLIIVNPRADHRPEDDLRLLDHRLRRSLDAASAWTTHPGHVQELVNNNQHCDGFIAVGGDGTISDVVNGLVSDRHALGIIAAGTGNGLARDLGLLNLATAVRALQRPRFTRLDWIAVRFRQQDGWHQRRMISTSAVGYVAGATDVSYRHKRVGLHAHTVGAVLQTLRQQPFEARLRFDGGPVQSLVLTNLTIHNTQYIGPFRLFPEARLDDGRLNVLHGCLHTMGQLLEDLAILTQTCALRRCARTQARQVEIELVRPSTVMVDGTLYNNVSAIEYIVEPGRLSCCIGERHMPKQAKRRQFQPAAAR